MCFIVLNLIFDPTAPETFRNFLDQDDYMLKHYCVFERTEDDIMLVVLRMALCL